MITICSFEASQKIYTVSLFICTVSFFINESTDFEMIKCLNHVFLPFRLKTQLINCIVTKQGTVK